ncbi:MAG TPA: Lrp/AsnC family transcriptional regulator [Spirochaetales bacterium]|nr:Lrp/AsnC family transcriptional regulator [Spirochaetales bacterium]
MKIDKTYMAIIKQIRDGRKSYKQIADELAITENTVRSRVKKLMDEGVLEIAGLVNPDKLPDHYFLIVGIKLKTMDLVNKGEEFSKLKGVVNVSVVTGRFDLILTVLLRNDFNLLDFYTREVSTIAEVDFAETFVVYKNYNVKVPYIL